VPVAFAPRNRWKAELRRDGTSVVKDYGDRPFLVRCYGRLCLRWEEKALRRLEGIEGVPRFLGRPTRDSLCMQALPGVPLATLHRGELSRPCFENLRQLFSRMHERGVAHGDAHCRNILVDGDRPCLLDYSTAFTRDSLPLLGRVIFRRVAMLDDERLWKIERSFFGTGTRPRMFLLYRIIRGFKKWVH
jgi:hypothetical protein